MATLMEKDVLLSMPSSIFADILKTSRKFELDKKTNMSEIIKKHSTIIKEERKRLYLSNEKDLDFKLEIKKMRDFEKAFYNEVGLKAYYRNMRKEKIKIIDAKNV